MLNDIYNKRIIELAGNIPRLGRLPDPHASATAHSKLCGSTVKVDLKMDGPVVTDFAHDVKACALGQASSSIMASHVVGSTAGELRELRETVRKMLKENGGPAARQMGRHRPARTGARLQGPPRLDHADLRRRGRRHRPDRSQGEADGVGVRGRAQHVPPSSCPAKAGHPVRREFSINHRRRGVLDHPLSRMMTPSAGIQLTSAAAGPARLQSRRSEPRLRRSWWTCPAAVAPRPRRRN